MMVLVTVGAVYIHTHTGYNLVNILKDVKDTSLFVIEKDK